MPEEIGSKIKLAPKLIWSEYQQAIFKAVSNGTGNVAVIARAGSSKTTSLVEAIRHVPKGKKILVAAFNKIIAEELRTRISDTIDVRTLHSLGYAAIRAKFGNVQVDNKKCLNIITELTNETIGFPTMCEVSKTVSFCKSSLIDTPTKIKDLMWKYDIDCGDLDEAGFVGLVIKTLGECKKQTKVIDFDDMVWFSWVWGLNIGSWDYLFLDEAQDMSYSQLIMALKAASKNSRVFIFCDPFQAIYGFRCCDMESVQGIIDKLEPTVLSLPISYRCPKKVVELAQTLVPDIQHAPGAIDGVVEDLPEEDLLNTVKPGDVVISRTNAPLVKYCLKLLRMGKPANILGRDIGDNLTYFVKKSKKKTVAAFLTYLDKWRMDELKRVAVEKRDPDPILDKSECLSNLCEGCSTIKELKDNIKKLFDDVSDKEKTVFSSCHKFKGREGDRIFLLSWTFRPGGNQEERNLAYVGFSRSKRELYLVRK
jgi:superfamily I DNA/RNA helicase